MLLQYSNIYKIENNSILFLHVPSRKPEDGSDRIITVQIAVKDNIEKFPRSEMKMASGKR